MKIQFCGKCGRELTEGSGFCRFCGWKVLQPEPEEIQTGLEPPAVEASEKTSKIFPDDSAHEKNEPEPINNSLPEENSKTGQVFPADKPEKIQPDNKPVPPVPSFEKEKTPPDLLQSPVKPKRKLPLPVLIGAVLLVAAGVILWQTVFKSAELMQPPLVTENGIFLADFGRDSRLYRLDLDGKSKTKLSDEYVKNMAFEDGWIYYSGISGLYKIREDGTDETEILKQSSESLQVADGWIYFVKSRDYHICRVKTDGAAFEELGQDFASNLKQDGGWLYYQNVDAEHAVYRIRTDGTERQPVTPEGCFTYNVDAGVVYYSNRDDYGYLYRIIGDGTGQRKLNEHNSSSMVIADGWIYYAQGWQGYPAKIKTDGLGETQVGKDSADDLAVSGEWLYYTHTEKGRRLFRIRTDGSSRQKLN